MDLANTPKIVAFEADLKRRVKNLALGPRTPSNALVPVYEAIFNSLHALQDRFDDSWVEKSEIEVHLVNLEGPNPSVKVMDNGIGLDEANFKSFRTYDSALKTSRGGKGVGRLSWLKVFQYASIESRFLHEGKVYCRKFDMVLNNEAPIKNHHIELASSDRVGTAVTLHEMRSEYATHMPSRLDTILRRLIGQFLPFLLASEKPNFSIKTDDESYTLDEYLKQKELNLGDTVLALSEDEHVTVSHNLIERGIVEGKANHKLYFAAHDRIVNEQEIGTALGLNTYVTRDGRGYVYAGVISGKILDDNVNAERTAFAIDASKIARMIRDAITLVQKSLAIDISKVVDRQTELTRSVLRRYPRFSYIVQDPRKFAEEKLPRNFRTAEQVYQQLAVFDFRENRDLQRRVERLSNDDGNSSEKLVQEAVDEIIGKLTDQEFSVLADYTTRRRVILDLLEKRLGYRSDGTMRHEAESALHEFIVPMRVDSHDVKVDHHNLWIVDDKLTYYEYWASDKSLKRLVQNSESLERPDVVLFSGRSAYHRPGTDQPVVIIEFKRPARDDYDDDQNPFSQVYGYIEELRSGRVLDKDGGVIQEVSEQTPFFCYIVADITPKLRSWMRMARINTPLAGGSAYYGYNDDYRAFVQVISYKYLIKDARLRNEAFFKHLSV